MLLFVATIAITAAPLFAGAVVEGAHRQQLFFVNSRALSSADLSIGPAMSGSAPPQQVIAARNEVVIRNSTLRDLVAIAYGVERWKVVGDPEWLDSTRYDVRALPRVPVSDPDFTESESPLSVYVVSPPGMLMSVVAVACMSSV